ncbi:MAG TPA: metallophosphoesterase [Clostridia bacterium]|jgi:3',5'-cyclic AMP phosphodiesterase CpdA|nr:metallophosphoesterase [Clostridia bacterium]
MQKIKKIAPKKVENNGLPAYDGKYWAFDKEKGKDFKILQLTDLHFGCGILCRKADKLAHNAVVTLVERTKPDLIVLTGDNIYPIPIFSGSRNNLKQSKYVADLFESFEIPWTTVFGNHDTEPFATHTREELCEFYASQKHCLMTRGDENISGVGNHIININGEDKTIMSLVMLDSNMYLGKSFFSTFDNIHDDQIEWYKKSIKEISGEGELVPSLAFFHMPLEEYRDAWAKLKMGKLDEVTYHLGTINEINDHVGFSRRKKGNFFEEMVKFGSLKGCFCGHDHLNNISMTYKGIRLTYGMAVDFLAYRDIRKKYTNRGGTVILVKDDGSFEVKLEPLTTHVEIYE